MSFKKSGELSVFQLIKNIKLKNTKLKNYKSEEKLDNKGPWIIINETPFFLHTVTSKQNTVLREKKRASLWMPESHFKIKMTSVDTGGLQLASPSNLLST